MDVTSRLDELPDVLVSGLAQEGDTATQAIIARARNNIGSLLSRCTMFTFSENTPRTNLAQCRRFSWRGRSNFRESRVPKLPLNTCHTPEDGGEHILDDGNGVRLIDITRTPDVRMG